MSRTVTLVLVTPSGELLGALPPFEVRWPYRQEVGEFAGEQWQILRLLHADGPEVTYLAETTAPPPPGLRPVDVEIAPHPRRAPYAEVGGPAASLAWARSVLGPGVAAHQVRTWNLSAIWRMERGGRPVAWLKQVPSFFAHEPAALRLVDSVAPGLVPPLIAAGDEGRMLLAHVEGEDRYGAGADVCLRIAESFVPVQAELAGHDLGAIPDGRISVERLTEVAAPWFERIDGLEKLLGGLPERLAAVDECGLPDTLVHGDLHPGNVRTDAAGRVTIMDWGDCTIGNPVFDILRLTEGLDTPGLVTERWAYLWEQARPGTQPMRAAHLLRPVAALRAAATYAGFLDAIEPSEWPYHAGDVPDCLSAAVATSIVKG